MSVFGFGFTNVLVALVILAVPPILTNAFVAVDEVEPEAVEAARGMGMTGWQTLRRVELPLALPLLFAGIRTAAVFVVASATIAAIAGGGGLGEILFNQASYRTEGLVGAAIVVSLLAFAADFALGLLQRVLTPRGTAYSVSGPSSPDVVVTSDQGGRRWSGSTTDGLRRRRSPSPLGVALLLGGTTAASAAPDRGEATPVIVGAKNFTEQYVLGQLYKQALEARGLKVSYKENIGSTEITAKALTSGQITLYPEYPGVC